MKLSNHLERDLRVVRKPLQVQGEVSGGNVRIRATELSSTNGTVTADDDGMAGRR